MAGVAKSHCGKAGGMGDIPILENAICRRRGPGHYSPLPWRPSHNQNMTHRSKWKPKGKCIKMYKLPLGKGRCLIYWCGRAVKMAIMRWKMWKWEGDCWSGVKEPNGDDEVSEPRGQGALGAAYRETKLLRERRGKLSAWSQSHQ